MVRELAADGIPVAVTCRVLRVSTSGYYQWRDRPPAPRTLADAQLTGTIHEIHAASHGTYGARRVHAELRLGRDLRVGRKRVERLMRRACLTGVHRRRLRGCTRRDNAPAAALAAHPGRGAQRRPGGPPVPRRDANRLWCADVTQHRTAEGWLYLAVVLDAFSRRVVGWAMADHLRSELVVDALQMAIWQRRPQPGAIHHADHGAQYTSWAFGQRLREAGLLGSMGTVGDALDNSVAESFFATLQTELLDRSFWTSRAELGQAIFAFIEGFYNPRRRHSTLGYLSPSEFEQQHSRQLAETAA